MLKKILTIALCIGCFLATGCGGKSSASEKDAAQNLKGQRVIAEFTTTMGSFQVQLATDAAPKTCANFIKLADSGFYKDTIFHRVIDGFMIQGGDPKGNGTGGPGYTIPDEFSSRIIHDGPGILSMANAGPNTGGSQFFITLEATPWLDGKHAAFGRVIQGLDVVKKIGKVKTDAQDKPVEPVVVKSITIKRL